MKLHPLTVPYRTVVGLVKYGVVFGFLFFGGPEFTPTAFPAVVAGLAVVLVVVVGGWHLAYYNRFDYELTAGTFDISSGVVSRRSREIPLARIQNVDVRENFLQRILGIAQLNLETAGGNVTEANLRYVDAQHARDLQEKIRRRKNQEATGEAGEPDEDVERQDSETLYEISPRELFLVSTFSIDLRLIAAVLFLASLVPAERFEAVEESLSTFVVLPALALSVFVVFVLWLIGFVTTFTRYYDFRLTRREDTLLYERGLFNRYSGSIPLDKVQMVSFQDNVLKRLFGYSTLSVDTAGYSPSQSTNQGIEVAVPLAKVDRVLSLARQVEDFGELDIRQPPKRARMRYVVRYTLVAAAVTAVLYGVHELYTPLRLWFLPLALLPLTPVAAHLKWRNRGYQEAMEYVVTRNGFWSRTTVVVPYYRVQNVLTKSTILQRRWRLATLTVDTAGTSLVTSNDGEAVDYDITEADEMRERVHDELQSSLTDRRLERERTAWTPADEPADADTEDGDAGTSDDATADREPTDDEGYGDGGSDDRGSETAGDDSDASGDESGDDASGDTA